MLELCMERRLKRHAFRHFDFTDAGTRASMLTEILVATECDRIDPGGANVSPAVPSQEDKVDLRH